MFAFFRGQPPVFYTIFIVEMWERFGFYTLHGVLAFYFLRFLGLPEKESYYAFGAFAALVYGMVSLGGYLGDRIFGTQRMLLWGLFTLALGYLSLAFSSPDLAYLSLGLICVGNGLFKSNPGSMLSKSYAPGDSRLHGAFTLYYMAVNLGAILALLAGPLLAARFGFSYAFFASFLGIALGLSNYLYQRKHLAATLTEQDTKPITFMANVLLFIGICSATGLAAYFLRHPHLTKNIVWMIALLVVSVYCWSMRKENKTVVLRMIVALILMAEAVMFFAMYQQMPTSLNVFAVHHIHAHFYGMSLNPMSLQVLNPIWIVTLSPILTMVYKRLQKQGWALAIPYKFAFGMTSCAVSFLVLFCTRYAGDDQGLVSPAWLIASYFFQSIGELMISALGAAMVSELVPQKMTGFVLGMWYLITAVASFIGAKMAALTALPPHVIPGIASLPIYTHVFGMIGLAALMVAFFMWLAAPILTRLLSKKLLNLKQSANDATYPVGQMG